MAIVVGDRKQLQQVFLNILTNAEEFMTEANGGGTLEIKVTTDDDTASISFADDGPGIQQQDIAKAFDPFFTTKEVGKGSGLGLSICYGIVKEHNGTISVESIPGQGATFTVELPLVKGRPGSPSGDNSTDATRPWQAMNILVVDDEPMIT